ncbi:NAD(P)H-dependent oxidoreductase subunit E [Cyanobium sp. NS01]|uniref:NADH-quinone oxidoreductase subunit NuoE family protein n=1 Tax=Cyanobium sp. NS01 TaxID=261284 RepID=UPI0016492EA5|nr:NAD(P)H-dependent oxidoreductase subunit E [Cyanobium sp. NS01]QNI71503.1 diaphorase subunit of the bidirectional hydrogenase [Cyanobium sp. NS01]
MAATLLPPSPAEGTPPAPDARISRIVRRHGARPGELIEVLHRVQELLGWLPPQALAQVARELQLPQARVYGVASFYHLFRLRAPTAHRCCVCLGTACFVKGGAVLAAQLERRLALRLDDPAGNGAWSLETVSCLGACSQAPVLVVDGGLEAKLPLDQPERLEQRLAGLLPEALAAPTQAGS